MLKHVLVPLDGSEVATKAVDYACSITAPDGQITLLTALDVPEYPAMAFYPSVIAYDNNHEVMTEQLIPQAQEYLQSHAQKLREAGYQVNIETVVDEAANAIVEKADAAGVDAIVMSTHGRSGLSRWLFGSVANKVLGSTQCPVFIIPVRNR